MFTILIVACSKVRCKHKLGLQCHEPVSLQYVNWRTSIYAAESEYLKTLHCLTLVKLLYLVLQRNTNIHAASITVI
jgi:hypothetical protein